MMDVKCLLICQLPYFYIEQKDQHLIKRSSGHRDKLHGICFKMFCYLYDEKY